MIRPIKTKQELRFTEDTVLKLAESFNKEWEFVDAEKDIFGRVFYNSYYFVDDGAKLVVKKFDNNIYEISNVEVFEYLEVDFNKGTSSLLKNMYQKESELLKLMDVFELKNKVDETIKGKEPAAKPKVKKI